MKTLGICFSKNIEVKNPLEHIKSKRSVYLLLLELCQKAGWKTYVLTRKTYDYDNGVYRGGWLFDRGKFIKTNKDIFPDVVYDRVGGVNFPPEDAKGITYVDRLDFKKLAWDKWKIYGEIGQYMPKTYWVGDLSNLDKKIRIIETNYVVVKPYDGLKGIDIFIGPKEQARDFKPKGNEKKFIIQDFIDTANGIPGITPGKHDLRVIVVNGKVVWCNVRVPAKGKLLANAAQGGTLTEVDYNRVPEKIKTIVKKISESFFIKYDNPIFSLDFGIGLDRIPKVFEINDQIGFPRWEMKNRDTFLIALIANFDSRIIK